jgi:putative nucleotidyltransferase with HDIG domain
LKKAIHPVLKEIASIFNSNEKELYLVGGAVRDMVMGKKIHDWDLATDALPEEVTSIVKAAGGKVFPTGIKHGTVTVLYKKQITEITTFRTESDYSDGRRPDKVFYAGKIEEDLSRRDFTMNAIALRLPREKIIDPFDGVKDIKAKIIRCVGDASKRFSEDGLRPMRAIRFACQLKFKIDKNTLDAIQGSLETCVKVSWERVRDEIDKMLDTSNPSTGFLLMEKTGLLELFLNELFMCRSIEQKGFHSFDVLDHSLLACDYAAEKNYSREIRLAALFHDIGKPQTRKLCENGIWTFYRHEEVSTSMCRTILNRLRYPNAVIDNVCHLVKEHMFNYTEDWTDAAVRRFIARVGLDNLENLYRLRRSDTYGFSGKESNPQSILLLVKRVDKILEKSRSFSLKDLAVSGRELITAGIPGGKIMGIILRQLLETVLDDPEQNTKEKLLEIAGKLSDKLKLRAASL